MYDALRWFSEGMSVSLFFFAAKESMPAVISSAARIIRDNMFLKKYFTIDEIGIKKSWDNGVSCLYFVPVCPKPPAPRSVASRLSVTLQEARL